MVNYMQASWLQCVHCMHCTSIELAPLQPFTLKFLSHQIRWVPYRAVLWRVVPYDMVRSRHCCFNTRIFHMHCTALQYGNTVMYGATQHHSAPHINVRWWHAPYLRCERTLTHASICTVNVIIAMSLIKQWTRLGYCRYAHNVNTHLANQWRF